MDAAERRLFAGDPDHSRSLIGVGRPTDPPPNRALAASLAVAAGRRVDDASRSDRDRFGAFALGGGFALVAVALAASGGSVDLADSAFAAVLGVMYGVVHRIELESALGGCVPTEPVLVVALLTLPVRLVPLVLLIALCGASLTLVARTPRAERTRLFALRAFAGWHCIGPTLVLLAVVPSGVGLRHWPLYLVALAAQFVVDALSAIARLCSLGESTGQLIEPLLMTFTVDALLAVVGLSAVLASPTRWGALLFISAPIGLVWLFSRDRRLQLDRSVVLGEAVEGAQLAAETDSMTGLHNRRAWDRVIVAVEAELLGPEPPNVVVVVADLDHLKAANDLHGHEAGDALIVACAGALRNASQEARCVARVGGDEFAILYAGSEVAVPRQLIADLRAELDRSRTPHGLRVSASLGACALTFGMSLAEVVSSADEAAYADKRTRAVARRSSDHGTFGQG